MDKSFRTLYGIFNNIVAVICNLKVQRPIVMNNIRLKDILSLLSLVALAALVFVLGFVYKNSNKNERPLMNSFFYPQEASADTPVPVSGSSGESGCGGC